MKTFTVQLSYAAYLVEQGQSQADVLLVERGAVALERDGQRVGRLIPGNMLVKSHLRGNDLFRRERSLKSQPHSLAGPEQTWRNSLLADH